MSDTYHHTCSLCLSNTMPDVLYYAMMSIEMFKEIRVCALVRSFNDIVNHCRFMNNRLTVSCEMLMYVLYVWASY